MAGLLEALERRCALEAESKCAAQEATAAARTALEQVLTLTLTLNLSLSLSLSLSLTLNLALTLR